MLPCVQMFKFVAILGQERIARIVFEKNLPPAQLCVTTCRRQLTWGATGSGASTQQHLKSCLIVGVGGRVSPLQRLWNFAELNCAVKDQSV